MLQLCKNYLLFSFFFLPATVPKKNAHVDTFFPDEVGWLKHLTISTNHTQKYSHAFKSLAQKYSRALTISQ